MFVETIMEQMAKSIRYVKPIPYRSATGLVAQTYQQMQSDFFPVPLLTVHSPAPQIMTGVWSILRESLLAGNVNRTQKEVTAAAVSKTNECPFCVDAHSLMLRAGSDGDLAAIIRRGDYSRIANAQLHALVQWVLANRTANASDALPAPFSAIEGPEIIGTAITFHYINRMVNVFLGDTLLPLPTILKNVTEHLLGAAGKRFVRRLPAGNSLSLIPTAELPPDLSWAAPNPAVAGAFAGFAEVIDAAGEKVLSEPVRALVSKRIRAWNGEPTGISRHWFDEAVAEL